MTTPSDPTTLHDPATDPYQAPPTPPRNGLGTAALVLGIVGLLLSPGVVTGVVLGVLAMVLGLVARTRVRHGEATNGRAATAGVVLGAVAIVVAVVVGVLVAPRVLATVEPGAGGPGAGGAVTRAQCVRNADGDRAAVRRCRQQAAAGGHGKHQGRTAPTPGTATAPGTAPAQGAPTITG